MSNGGYLVRWQLENHPELYDGGVDWEGTLWRASGPNLLTFLPPALRHYPVYAAGGPGADEAHRAMLAAGYPAGSEFLWPFHHQYYWDLTQRIYREELDPAYDGPTEAGTPYCAPGTPACDADYDYASRPRQVHRAVASIGLTGRIGKPLITLHGTLDVLLPIGRDSDVYARMVRDAGRGGLFRYYRVEGGTHVDSLYDAFPDRLRPLTPCHRSAFTALEAWIGQGSAAAAQPHRGPPGRRRSGHAAHRLSARRHKNPVLSNPLRYGRRITAVWRRAGRRCAGPALGAQVRATVRVRVLAEDGPQVWIAVSGRLSRTTAPALAQALLLREAEGFTVFFVDVSALTDDWELTLDEVREVFPCGRQAGVPPHRLRR